MPSLPASSPQALIAASSSSSEADMIENNANGQIHRSASTGTVDTEMKNYRNRANSKVKLLVRSLAMRESASPPRGDQSPNGSTSSGQSLDGEIMQISNLGKKYSSSSNSLSPVNVNGKQLNNNETIPNSNLNSSNYSPKQTRNSATSPTCHSSPHNGPSSPSLSLPKNSNSPTNLNSPEDCKKSKGNSSNNKCNNCYKNGHNERPVLLQTPISPSKNQKNAQNNQHNKSEQRRPNNNICHNQCSAQCGNTLSVNRTNSRHKLRHQNSSSQGSYESASPSLSRDNSTELYTDSTGIDLEHFIAETINRNQKDRTVLLRIEKDLIEFVKDKQKASHKFPNMSSYNRMLVHRVAAYFGMEHNVDQSGLSVIITRTKNMRIPDKPFKEHIRDDIILGEEPRRSILKRDSNSFEDSFSFKSPDRMSGDYCRRSKSFEEREEEYEKARRRIFENSNRDNGDVSSWPYWSSTESSDGSSRYRLLPPSEHCYRQTRLSKGDSLDGRESYRSNGSRPSVSKSYSFGGYTRGAFSRGDSVNSTHSAGPRLMKQDSGASMCSRLSPSSSGYKSQSQRSDTTISPSPSPSPIPNMTCNHSQISSQDIISPEPNNQTIMWAVTSISSVPAGSVIINPQNNQPYTNPDGSIYRFDPENPPKLFIEDVDTQDSSRCRPLEIPETHRSVTSSKNDCSKRRSQTTKGNSGSGITTTTTTTTTVTTTTPVTHVTNSATSPSLPFTPSPIPQLQAESSQPSSLLPPLIHQPPPPPPPLPPPAQQQSHQQPAVTTVTVQSCNHQSTQQYTTYVPATSESFGQNIYAPCTGQPTVMMAHPPQGQPQIQNTSQEDPIYNQNPIYGNYSVPVQPQIPQAGQQEVSDISGYFMGMNMYDHRATVDGQLSNHPYPQPPPVSSQSVPNLQTMQQNYWPSITNQVPTQQTMYFVQPPGTTVPINQNPGDRQHQCPQQQRLNTSYSINVQTVTPPTQTNAGNYVSSYPVSYNTMTAVTPSPAEYTCQPSVHMVPAYYQPGQPGIQHSPVMYRVPTPPNTPTTSQVPNMPVMYMNSNSYPTPAMIPTGTFGPQVGPNGTPGAPAGGFVSPLVPNLMFRQNVPLVTGVRASTPGNSQRASRSPTPAHDFFGVGSGDRNAQPPTRYPLPMYQGVHIVQGDMRLMHPGVPGNPRLQYAPVPSPPVVQGCPRPYRPPSNTSNSGNTGLLENKNSKLRKQKSKTTSVPSSRPNTYHPSPSATINSNAPKDVRDAIVKVTITPRNQLIQY